MKRNLVAVCILSFGLLGAGVAQGSASQAKNGAQLTKAQLKQLIVDAHTTDQYNTLAAYYADRQNDFQKQADDEKQEWLRRSQNIVGSAAKYPRPVDSARNLYEYYAYEASEAGALAAKYTRLAVPDSTTKSN